METRMQWGLVAVIGALALFIGYQLGRHDVGVPGMPHQMNHADMTMAEMTEGLRGKTGDDFDRAFVEMMIVHHEGAVEMARLIPAQAEHAELKQLGEDIITAQTREIEMMRGWLKSWAELEARR